MALLVNQVKSLSKTVTTAGTAVALSATSIGAIQCAIRAKEANLGVIYIGASDVDNTAAPLNASESVSWESDNPNQVVDLKNVYIDSSVNGEGVDVWYLQQVPA